MSSRMHGSEEALATLGCRRARTLPPPSCSSAASAWASRCARRSTSCRLPPRRRRRADARRRRMEPRRARCARRVIRSTIRACGSRSGRPRRAARQPGRFEPCCSTWTTGPPRSPPRPTPNCIAKRRRDRASLAQTRRRPRRLVGQPGSAVRATASCRGIHGAGRNRCAAARSAPDGVTPSSSRMLALAPRQTRDARHVRRRCLRSRVGDWPR